jgi:hypothetical protein
VHFTIAPIYSASKRNGIGNLLNRSALPRSTMESSKWKSILDHKMLRRLHYHIISLKFIKGSLKTAVAISQSASLPNYFGFVEIQNDT